MALCIAREIDARLDRDFGIWRARLTCWRSSTQNAGAMIAAPPLAGKELVE
jgi:hypothetical protein